MTTTKKMEEFFNLSASDMEEVDEEESFPVKTKDELMAEARSWSKVASERGGDS